MGEGIKDQGERGLESRQENEGRESGEEKEKGESNLEYERTHDLLKDFSNLKVRGLLPDSETRGNGESIFEMQEWRVIVFPWGQGRGKKVIHLDPSYNSPPKEEDWARPCCGTICAMQSVPLQKIADHE